MRLSVEALVKRFGRVSVLDGVSLEVPQASITGLIGPNGSGKSTLFDVVTGFVAKDGGSMSLDGAPLEAAPHELAARGLVRTFQIPRVARQMTLLENFMAAPPNGAGESLARLFSPFHVRRVRQDERERLEQAWTLLESLGLDHHANELAGVLSGGQLKLLSIGIALMASPDTLLLDEPTAGVNPVLIERILGLLAARKAQGRTTFVIEHNIPVLSELADTIYVLHAGQIIAHGPPRSVQDDERVIDAYLGRRVKRTA